jgi:hypothetical protein
METKKDITLICNQCGNEFTFSVNDQEFYEKQGWNTQPKKCKKCCAIRNQLKNKNG